LDAAVQKRHSPFSESNGSLHLDLPSDPSLGMASERAKETIEKKLILETLDKTQWHQGRAATILKVDPKTLYNKMKSYGIRGR
jgi:two-component system response regulator HydG